MEGQVFQIMRRDRNWFLVFVRRSLRMPAEPALFGEFNQLALHGGHTQTSSLRHV